MAAEMNVITFGPGAESTSFDALNRTCVALLQNGVSVCDVLGALVALQTRFGSIAAESKINPKLVQPAPPGMNGTPRIVE